MSETMFTWIIKDFDMYPHLPGERLSSPTFSIDSCKTTKFSLHLYPKGYKEIGKEEYVSLYLKRQSDGGKVRIPLQYELCLLDASGTSHSFQKSERCFFKNTSWGCLKFYERNLLLRSLRHRFLPENKLTVRCKIVSLDPAEEESSEIEYEELSHDVGELLESGRHSDMTVIVDGIEFKLHRTILECRCPKLIEQLVKVGDPNTYTLPGIEARLLRFLLTYLYTGVYKDCEFLEQLIVAADSYGLSDLKSCLVGYPAHVTAVTETDVFESACTWILDDFKDEPVNKQWVCHLVSDEMPKWSWMKLSAITLDEPTGSHRRFAMTFQRLNKNVSSFIQCAIKVVDKDGAPLRNGWPRFEHKFENEDAWFIFAFKLRRVLQDGDFRLRISIRTSLNRQSAKVKEVVTTPQKNTGDLIKKKAISSFQRDFKSLYQSMKNADVILSVNGVKMPAHKVILCARSEVFSKMFVNNYLETQRNVVKIKQIEASTVASMLTYMYCGFIDGPLLSSRALKLYAASNRYQLLGLQGKCSTYLKTVMKVERMDEVILADKCYYDNFRAFLIEFVKSIAPLKLIRTEKDFEELQDMVHIYPEILAALQRNQDNKVV